MLQSYDGFPVLKVVPGVTALTPYDRNKLGAAVDLNKIGLYLKLDTGSGPKMINVHFTEKMQSLLECALIARRKVQDKVGEAIILETERQVSLAAAAAMLPPSFANLTEAEKEWLAQWFDGHLDPSIVTLEEAAAAMNSHRSSASASTSTCAFGVLSEAQLGAPAMCLTRHALALRLPPSLNVCSCRAQFALAFAPPRFASPRRRPSASASALSSWRSSLRRSSESSIRTANTGMSGSRRCGGVWRCSRASGALVYSRLKPSPESPTSCRAVCAAASFTTPAAVSLAPPLREGREALRPTKTAARPRP